MSETDYILDETSKDEPIIIDSSPKEINGYKIKTKIKNTVFTATKAGKTYVLKEARPIEENGALQHISGNAALRFEAQLQALCEHPHVTPVHEVFDYKGLTYLALPKIGRANLETIQPALESDKDNIILLAQIAKALNHCHKTGIIHLDIKEQNVFVNEQGAFLGDFGASRMEGYKHPYYPENVVVATTFAVAPEYLIKCAPTKKSDVFSFCRMAYWALTRDEPFEMDVDDFIKYTKPTHDKHKLPGLELVIKGLSVKEEKRPPMDEIADLLMEQASKYHPQPNGYSSEPYPAPALIFADQTTKQVQHTTASYETGQLPQLILPYQLKNQAPQSPDASHQHQKQQSEQHPYQLPQPSAKDASRAISK